MLGGALQSRALSHLSLQQDADGFDLAGLRDLTKSAAATTALESQIACERVLGGRSVRPEFARAPGARNMHVFGVVEGEDDLILMGMVKDVTDAFTTRYMAGMLGVIQSINEGPDGKPLPPERRILRITPLTMPARAQARAAGDHAAAREGRLLAAGTVDRRQPAARTAAAAAALLPTSWLPRYQLLPRGCAATRASPSRGCAALRWAYLGINLWFQLELTRAQIPLQRLGKVIEQLVSMLALCHHAAALQDESLRKVAALQCEQLATRVRGTRLLTGLCRWTACARWSVRSATTSRRTSARCCGRGPQPFAHPFEPPQKKRKG
jgi:hypothetical protein